MRMPCTMAVNKNEKHGFESKMRRGNFDPRVYLVTDRRTTTGWTVEQIVEAAIRGNGKQKGVTFVQYVREYILVLQLKHAKQNR